MVRSRTTDCCDPVKDSEPRFLARGALFAKLLNAAARGTRLYRTNISEMSEIERSGLEVEAIQSLCAGLRRCGSCSEEDMWDDLGLSGADVPCEASFKTRV